MASSTIPPKYAAQLEPVVAVDERSDEEILQSLTQHVPVTSEKNIWAYWHAGLLAMPAWCQRNVIDWVRICGDGGSGSGSGGWTIRVLDQDPDSPNYALRYLEPALFPEAFRERTMDGPYSGPHAADFIRSASIYQHGGVFMDVGCILIRHMDRFVWDALADPASPYEVAAAVMYGQTIHNHFVAARKGNPFIKRWHDLFTHLWRGHTNSKGLLKNPLMAFANEINMDESKEADFKWDWAVDDTTIIEYVTQIACWMRLCMLEDAGDGFSGSDYWQTHIYTFSALPEDQPAEHLVGFDSQKIFDLLTLRRDDVADPRHAEAEALVWDMLSAASLNKISHGVGLLKTPLLGVLLDRPENEGMDCVPGTFFELLRYGTVHFRQTRPEILRVPAAKAEKTVKKGLLEP